MTTPQPTARRVASRAARMADRVDQKLIGVVENMSWFTGDDGKRYHIFGEGGGAALARRHEVELLAQVPILPEMRAGADGVSRFRSPHPGVKPQGRSTAWLGGSWLPSPGSGPIRNCGSGDGRALNDGRRRRVVRKGGRTARLPLTRHYVIGRRPVKGLNTKLPAGRTRPPSQPRQGDPADEEAVHRERPQSVT